MTERCQWSLLGVGQCSLEVEHGGSHEYAPEPVAPVKAKEKNRMTYEETKQRFGLPVAEPKPTPSTLESGPYGSVVAEFLAYKTESHARGIGGKDRDTWLIEKLIEARSLKPQPDSSSIPDLKPWLDQAVDLLNLYHSGNDPKDVAKDFLEKCRLNFGNVAEYKPFVDSSSISTEQTFEDVLRNRAGEYQDMGREHRKKEEYAAACCCEDKASGLYVAIKLYRSWNAAKGQSNGR